MKGEIVVMNSKEIIAAKRKADAPNRILRNIARISVYGLIIICIIGITNMILTSLTK
jgi:hypothetical protein